MFWFGEAVCLLKVSLSAVGGKRTRSACAEPAEITAADNKRTATHRPVREQKKIVLPPPHMAI